MHSGLEKISKQIDKTINLKLWSNTGEEFQLPYAVAYSEPGQAPKMERFAKIVNSLKSSTIFAKRSILEL